MLLFCTSHGQSGGASWGLPIPTVSTTSQKAGIRITWPGQGENVLCILRSRSATHSQTELYRGGATAFVDSGSAVANGKVIEYQLYVAETVSPFRSAQSDWTPGFTYISPVGGLTLTKQSGVWTLQWSASDWADSYNVYLGSSESYMPLFASTATTSYVIGANLPITPRVYSIRAVNSKGGSTESERIWTTGAPSIATGKPPYACTTPFYPVSETSFQPARGSLRLPEQTGFGPQSSGDPVNLATGQEVYTPSPDIVAYNPNGVDAVFARSYRSSSAQVGYGSPGLSAGWVHNFDARIYGNPSSQTWHTLTLAFANGALEQLTPLLVAGVPSGQFLTVAGAQYRVTGVPDSLGKWLRITILWKDGTQWIFTPHSSGPLVLTTIQNSLGHGVTISYLPDRRLNSIADLASLSVLLSFDYSAASHLTSATDFSGRRVWYAVAAFPLGLQHASASVLVSASVPQHQAVSRASYGYAGTQSPLLASITVPSPTGVGVSTCRLEWGWISAIGRTGVTKLIDGNGMQTVFSYSPNLTQVSIRNQAGIEAHRFTQKWSNEGRNLGTVDVAGYQYSLVYGDPLNPNLVTQVIDPKGRAETMVYDPYGNLQTLISRRGLITTYAIDYSSFPLGRLAGVVVGSGLPTTYEHLEPSGLLHSVTAPRPGGGLSTTNWTYDAIGNVTSIVLPGNASFPTRTTTYDYQIDGGYSQPAKAGQVLRVTDASGAVMRFRYDSHGRAIWNEDALGRVIQWAYDLAGATNTITYPASGASGSGRSRNEFEYLYPAGPVMRSSNYDESGVVIQEIRHLYGHEGEKLRDIGADDSVAVAYDAAYRPIRLVDSKGGETLISYSSRGTLASMTGAGAIPFTVLATDACGLATSVADGEGEVKTIRYDDPEDFITQVDYVGAPEERIVSQYNSLGQLVFQSDESGSHSWIYGSAGELQSQTTQYTGQPSVTLSYTYNADGSRSRLNSPVGQFSYEYDVAGRLTQQSSPFGETTSYDYRLDGAIQRRTRPTGGYSEYQYNALAERIAVINYASQGTLLSSFLKTAVSGTGQATGLSSLRPSHPSYSGDSQLSFSSAGELLQEFSTRNGGYSASYQFDSVGNALSMRGQSQGFDQLNQLAGTGYQFNLRGEPTLYQGQTLTWTAGGNLRSVGANFLAGYRADGLRAYKQNGLGERIYTIYDGFAPLLELSSQGTVTAVNTFGPDGLVSRRSGGVSVFYTFDERGGLAERLAADDSILSSSIHDAYGYSISSPPVTDPFRSFGAQFGYRVDDETGLILCGYRYYDSSTGRWMSRDRAGFAGGANAYRYVGNDPFRFVDPLGWYQEVFVDPLDLWDMFGPDRLKFTTGDEAVSAYDNWNKPYRRISNIRKEKFWNEELSKGLYQRHHVFPKAFKAQFEKIFWKGFIDEKVFKVPQTFHRGVHTGTYGCRGGWWNSQWQRFFSQTKNPTIGDVWNHLEKMMKAAGIRGFSTKELRHIKQIPKPGLTGFYEVFMDVRRRILEEIMQGCWTSMERKVG
ncbi:RHS repeat-associated core domain-containing protein [Kamptonema cortianum]|nr:RHS repeat-associated core domain-containing protein [Geitlerinema splendidum]MDK3157035.1 RHS repeat-associated core domain-containing protein [Kamptonema cortianum]